MQPWQKDRSVLNIRNSSPSSTDIKSLTLSLMANVQLDFNYEHQPTFQSKHNCDLLWCVCFHLTEMSVLNPVRSIRFNVMQKYMFYHLLSCSDGRTVAWRDMFLALMLHDSVKSLYMGICLSSTIPIVVRIDVPDLSALTADHTKYAKLRFSGPRWIRHETSNF